MRSFCIQTSEFGGADQPGQPGQTGAPPASQPQAEGAVEIVRQQRRLVVAPPVAAFPLAPRTTRPRREPPARTPAAQLLAPQLVQRPFAARATVEGGVGVVVEEFRIGTEESLAQGDQGQGGAVGSHLRKVIMFVSPWKIDCRWFYGFNDFVCPVVQNLGPIYCLTIQQKQNKHATNYHRVILNDNLRYNWMSLIQELGTGQRNGCLNIE